MQAEIQIFHGISSRYYVEFFDVYKITKDG